MGKASESGGFEPGYRFTLIGGHQSDPSTDIIATKINFLKTATLLTELDGKNVSEEALLGALAAIQKRVEKKVLERHERGDSGVLETGPKTQAG